MVKKKANGNGVEHETMRRVTVFLTVEHWDAMKEIEALTAAPISRQIRRALDLYVEEGGIPIIGTGTSTGAKEKR